MRKLWLVAASLLLLGAASPGPKKTKFKKKEFQVVVKADPKDYSGCYVGIDSTYFLDVLASKDSGVAVTVHDGETTTKLRDPQLNGAVLEGTATGPDGKAQPFEAVFGERTLDNQKAFGLLVTVKTQMTDDFVVDRLFCKLRPSRTPAP